MSWGKIFCNFNSICDEEKYSKILKNDTPTYNKWEILFISIKQNFYTPESAL